MQWGVFESNDGSVHVAPIDAPEDTTTHLLSASCPCHPAHDDHGAYQGTKPLLVHEWMQ